MRGTLDQHRGVHMLGREILEPECSGIDELGSKNHLVLERRLGVEVQLNLKIIRCQVAGIDVDRDVDVGLCLLRRKRLGSIGIFETEILQVLSENPQ